MMDASDQTNAQLIPSPCAGSPNNLNQASSTAALETSPLSSPSTSSDQLPHESSREFFASRESFASGESSLPVTPPVSVPNSPRTSIEAHTPMQRFVNALDSPPPESLTSPRMCSETSNSTSASLSAATCVVCMDHPKDIVLSPCQHSHCCLACFRRTRLYTCPVCRTPVRSVKLLSTRLELPVSLVIPKPVAGTQGAMRGSATISEPEFYEPVMYERPRPLITRRSAPVFPSSLGEEASSIHSRTTSVSSVRIARQAASSVRSIPRSQEAAFRRLRETGTVPTPSELPRPLSDSGHRRHNLSTGAPTVSTDRNLTYVSNLTRTPLRNSENIVLIGHDRKLMLSLAQKLIAAFPPPPNTGRSHSRNKSTFVVNGKVLRLVIIEYGPSDTGPQLALRIQRQAPKLVLMCADFFNISSFESIVRLDMEVLDYLNLPCTWVLIKSLGLKRSRRSNSVGDADVRAAKHFLSSPRRCFLITVDVAQENMTMRRLGYYLYKTAYKGSSSADSGSILSEEHQANPRKAWSFFCIRIDLKPKQHRLRQLLRETINFGRWLK